MFLQLPETLDQLKPEQVFPFN